MWDTQIPGFGSFCGKASKTFYYQRTTGSRVMCEKIGSFPLVSAGVARDTALELAMSYQNGVAAKKLNASKNPTLEQATNSYLAQPNSPNQTRPTKIAI